MLLLKCAVFNSKKSKFLKDQETREVLRTLLGIKVPILGGISIVNTLF